jgi:transmembrane sensor
MVTSVLEKLILGGSLSSAELKELKKAFKDNSLREEIDEWLVNNWERASYDDLEISYDRLKQMITEYDRTKQTRKGIVRHLFSLSLYYQRVAAVLFIPLILGTFLYLHYSQNMDENFYVAEAPLGQKAKIELPDGSTIWLNSGSQIRYSSEFNKKNRKVELEGEAFFDVKKNSEKPFFVNTPNLDIKVTGTRFNVNAYNDEPDVETALVEGKVNVFLKKEKTSYHLTPGNMLTYSKTSHEITSSALNEEVTTAWKDNRLIFVNDNFYKLAKKIEKWYNVEVVYDTMDFRNNKLTVRLLEGEQLNRLLEIVETAIGAKCDVLKNKIYITKKTKP